MAPREPRNFAATRFDNQGVARPRFEPGTHVSVLTIWGIRHHGIAGEDGRFYQNDIRTGQGGFREARAEDFYRDAIPGTEQAEPQRYAPAEALIRAKKKASWGEQVYDLTVNNCEHDAREVADGVRRSLQVEARAFLFGFFPGLAMAMMTQVGADLVSGRATNLSRLGSEGYKRAGENHPPCGGPATGAGGTESSSLRTARRS